MPKEKKKIKKESFMQAVFSLMFSQILIKLLGLIYTLYLTNKEGFGDAGNAIYLSAYQIYALLLTLSSIGVPNAISKLVSERTAIGDHKGAYRIFKIAFATFAVIGLVGTLILFFGADIIATSWIQIPEAKYTLIALSPAVFFVSIASVMRGYFNGRETMKVTARSQTLEQVFKAVLTIIIVEIIFICTSKNTVWMATGANIATTLSIFLSFMYLFYCYRSQRSEVANEIKQTVNYKYQRVKTIVKNILMVSIPMSLSAIMSSFNKNIDSFTVVRSLKAYMTEADAKIQYGILSGKVDTLTSLPLSINIAFATALVPAISAAIAKGDKSTVNKRVSFSLLASMLIGLPCTVGMIVFAEPILNLLFPNAASGALVLQISALTIIFTILDQTINGTLQGIGKVMVPATSLGIGMIVKLITNVILLQIPSIGVNGAAIGSVLCHMVAFCIAFNVLRKNVKLDLKFSKFVLKPLFATIIMAVCSYFVYFSLNGIIAKKMATIIAIVIAIIIYLLAIVALKVLTKEDIFMIPYGNKVYTILQRLGIYGKEASDKQNINTAK